MADNPGEVLLLPPSSEEAEDDVGEASSAEMVLGATDDAGDDGISGEERLGEIIFWLGCAAQN